MFSSLRNTAKLQIKLSPEGSFLIKARESLNPMRPDMEFVRLNTAYGETLYIPGSSLKGVTRSNVEALVTAMNNVVCNSSDKTCGRCDGCATFGSTSMASHVRFGDLLPWRISQKPEEREQAVVALQPFLNTRTNVAINRRKGSVGGGGPFEMEVLSGGSFFGEVVLENYDLWQMELILTIFDRIDDGTIRMGYGTSRGLGRVKLEVETISDRAVRRTGA